MKRSLVVVSLVSASIAAGCGVATTRSPSRFIMGFSPDEAIHKAHVQDDGKKQPTVLNSGASVGSGGLRVTHRSITAELSLGESDESQFLSKLKTEVAEQLRIYGAKTTGEGAGPNDSYLEYSEGSIAGVVEVSGIRGVAESYRLVILIAER